MVGNDYRSHPNPPRRAPPPAPPSVTEQPLHRGDPYARRGMYRQSTPADGNEYEHASMSSVSIMSSPLTSTMRGGPSTRCYDGHHLQRVQAGGMSMFDGDGVPYTSQEQTTYYHESPPLSSQHVTGTTQLDRSYSESRRTYHTAPAYDHLVTTYGGSNYYQQPHNYRDRIQAGIYEATVRKPVAYSHQRAAEENIPKRSNEVSPSLQKKYDSSSQEPDGEVDPPPIKDAGQGEDACISSQPELNASTREPNFPLGWSIASRFIPSGAVKREYDMSLSRPGSPSYKVRHEAIKFFQVLMSPETPHFQSVGEGWALNGFMYRLTRDDDVGVVLRQVEDPSKDGDTARILLSVITRDSRVGRGNTPKMTAAIDAWDFALRQLVSGATAQTVRSERNGIFRSYLDQYYFPGIPVSALPRWTKLSRPPRSNKLEYLTNPQETTVRQPPNMTTVHDGGTFERQGVTHEESDYDEYKVWYDS